MGRRTLEYHEATALLPAGDRVHTFVQAPTREGTVLLGADWSRQEILNILRQECPAGRVEVAGEAAAAMDHGIAVDRDYQGLMPLFIATEPGVVQAFERVKDFTEATPCSNREPA